jgi:hypothetical protein
MHTTGTITGEYFGDQGKSVLIDIHGAGGDHLTLCVTGLISLICSTEIPTARSNLLVRLKKRISWI